MKYVIVLMFLALVGCSSVPKYEKMRSLDDAVNEFDQDHIKGGMAITKKGAVVDIKVEEVQEQKRQLEAKLAEKEQALRNLNEDLAKTQEQYRTLRIFIGLPANPARPTNDGIDGAGNLVNFKAAPSLDQELASIKKKE